MNRFSHRPGFSGLIGLLMLAVASCSTEIRSDGSTAEGAEGPPQVDTPRPTSATDRGFSTHLYSERDADVYSRLHEQTGGENGVPVREIRLEIGARVQEGQVLAVLEDADARLALEAVRPRAQEAKHRYERMKRLFEQEMVSRTQYEEALYAHRRAQAELAQAELELSRTRIEAPFDGVVTRRYVRVGELVQEGDPVFRVTRMAPLRARLLVPEERSHEFRRGDLVYLRGVNGERDTARVVVVAPSIDPGSGTREIITELSDPDGFAPGASVVARLVKPQRASNR